MNLRYTDRFHQTVYVTRTIASAAIASESISIATRTGEGADSVGTGLATAIGVGHTLIDICSYQGGYSKTCGGHVTVVSCMYMYGDMSKP